MFQKRNNEWGVLCDACGRRIPNKESYVDLFSTTDFSIVFATDLKKICTMASKSVPISWKVATICKKCFPKKRTVEKALLEFSKRNDEKSRIEFTQRVLDRNPGLVMDHLKSEVMLWKSIMER